MASLVLPIRVLADTLLIAGKNNRYWGTSETLLPVYQDVAKAMAKHPDVDTIVNFASSRSVYSSTMELMQYPQIKSIAIIAEGVPERVYFFPSLRNGALT